MFTTVQVIAIVIAVCIGFLIGLLKDYLQQRLFIHNISKVGQLDSEEEMEKAILASGFALNEDMPEDVDSRNIETYYKGYYS